MLPIKQLNQREVIQVLIKIYYFASMFLGLSVILICYLDVVSYANIGCYLYEMLNESRPIDTNLTFESCLKRCSFTWNYFGLTENECVCINMSEINIQSVECSDESNQTSTIIQVSVFEIFCNF